MKPGDSIYIFALGDIFNVRIVSETDAVFHVNLIVDPYPETVTIFKSSCQPTLEEAEKLQVVWNSLES